MSYAIECYFDDKSNKNIDKIRSQFSSNDINVDNGTRPHISLAIYDTLPINSFQNRFREFPLKMESITISFSNFGIFPTQESVLFLSPKVSLELINFHNHYIEEFSVYRKNIYQYYTPENWIPHSTIGINLTKEMLQKSMLLLDDVDLPFEATIKEIGILEFYPNNEIISFPLMG